MTAPTVIHRGSRDAKVCLQAFILEAFGATDKVVFSRGQDVSIEAGQRASLSVWWGKEALGAEAANLQPTAKGRDCFVDIRAVDEETAETVYQELQLKLRDEFKHRYILVTGIEADTLINDNLESDGVRAIIKCRYVA